MIKDYTMIVLAFIVGVVVITWKALDEGINGAVLDSAYTFLGTIIGAVTLHYYHKSKKTTDLPDDSGGP